MRTTFIPPHASSGPTPGNGGGWPSKTGNPSGGGRSNNPPAQKPAKKIAGTSLLCLCAIALTACQHVPTWHKFGVTHHEMINHQSMCQYEISKSKMDHSERNTALTHCMQGKGFRWY